jgi:DNA polymerase III delta subunit
VIYLISGDNSYAVEQEVRRICRETGLSPKRVDGATLASATLMDYLFGTSLFGASELPVISELSTNMPLWHTCAEAMPRVDAATQLILIESRPDKRTKPYKTIVAHATVITCEQWTERDTPKAIAWLKARADSAGCQLASAQLRHMVERALVPGGKPGALLIDQMRLHTALQALVVLPSVSDDAIAAVMPANSNENVFELLAAAARDDTALVDRMMANLKLSDDPYKVFALVAGQLVQLATVAWADCPPEDFGIHPYVAQKFRAMAGQLSSTKLSSLLALAADLDSALKLSQVEPWTAVDRLLLGVTVRS